MHSISKYHDQVKTFTQFDQFTNTPFSGKKNAFCLERHLVGDFEEIVKKLKLKEDITEISLTDLFELNLSVEGNLAREIIVTDIKLLNEIGASPTLNLINCYYEDDILDFISTDVYSFHVDASPVSTDTYLCTYYGASSDILPNEMAIQKIMIPEIREKLKELHDPLEMDFETFLKSYHFDLHYSPISKESKPINLEIGNLWRLAVKHPEQLVEPCIHRAPKEQKQLRLLLIC